QLRVKCN
ncbi:hypothetical protein D047_1376B, partial [Vibrio parahaemolyticus VPTS-2010_2]